MLIKSRHLAFGKKVDAYIEARDELWEIVFFDDAEKYTMQRYATYDLARRVLYELAGEELPPC